MRPAKAIPFFLVFLTACFSALSRVEAGHESPYYPSFYPQEIRIETLDPASAATALRQNTLHAYVGGDPFEGGEIPANVGYAESLGAYLVATFNAAAASPRNREDRCAGARRILHDLAPVKEKFVFHPYPVTPYHADYLHHFDVVQALRKEFLPPSARSVGGLGRKVRISASGRAAEALTRSGWQVQEQAEETTIEEMDIGHLMSSRTVGLNGWLGPPWLKEGWFHAYLLLAETVSDKTRRRAVDAIYERLVSGAYRGTAERLNLERRLVSLLSRGCERVVIGYTVRREYFNTDYSAGAENIAHDSHTGFFSPVFIRTAKLKDFPWNGWLRLGIDSRTGAAWNPIGGFTDPAGRLIWLAVGDPALFPAPHSGSWIANRVRPTVTLKRSTSGRLEVPQDALIPEPGTGLLRKVGPGRRAEAKILYRVLTSLFHDGTRMAVADVLYPFIFASRWGVRRPQNRDAYDPSIDQSTAFMRERLAGLRVAGTHQEVKDLGELRLVWQNPLVEIYLNSTSSDRAQLASMAPPWSSVPWHLLVLMEEAVQRGLAAFSLPEAKRRGVGWLDLVRDQGIQARLAALGEEFESGSYIPDGLQGFTSADEAKRRWAALRQFYQKHGHFLVTNGPYQVEQWSERAAVLQVFRDLSYPLGVGSFDQYVLPPRAFISRIGVRNNRLRISAEVEKAVRAQRTHTIVREPLTGNSASGAHRIRPLCSYVVVGADGNIRRSGTARQIEGGTFTVDLRGLKPGRYTVVTAIYLDGNYVTPDVRAVPYRVEDG